MVNAIDGEGRDEGEHVGDDVAGYLDAVVVLQPPRPDAHRGGNERDGNRLSVPQLGRGERIVSGVHDATTSPAPSARAWQVRSPRQSRGPVRVGTPLPRL